jgi:protein SCO1/2
MTLRTLTRSSTTLVAAALALSALAQDGKTDVTKKIGLDQNLGVQIPLDTKFKDETGREVKIRDYFGDKPVVLAMAFYKCMGSCLLIRDGLVKTVNGQKSLKAGEDFEVVVLSIHPKETPELAMKSKKDWLSALRHEEQAEGFHFLTGEMPEIRAVTQAVGFRFTYDEKTDAVSHPAGIVILTPDGITSHYMYGVTYAFKDFHDGILKAAENEVGERAPEILWGCMQYDPRSGKYRVQVENVLKVAGIATALVLFSTIAVLSFRYRREALEPGDSVEEAPGQ